MDEGNCLDVRMGKGDRIGYQAKMGGITIGVGVLQILLECVGKVSGEGVGTRGEVYISG